MKFQSKVNQLKKCATAPDHIVQICPLKNTTSSYLLTCMCSAFLFCGVFNEGIAKAHNGQNTHGGTLVWAPGTENYFGEKVYKVLLEKATMLKITESKIKVVWRTKQLMRESFLEKSFHLEMAPSTQTLPQKGAEVLDSVSRRKPQKKSFQKNGTGSSSKMYLHDSILR